MNKIILISIIIVILIVAVGGYFLYASQNSLYKATPSSVTNNTTNTTTTTNTVTNTIPACTPSWHCGWSPCVNGNQIETAIDSNNCGLPATNTNIMCPALAKKCETQPTKLNASVSIKNFAFNPATLNIKVGTTVTWTNNDSMAHQLKSNTFNSAPLSNGTTFSFTFPLAGEYDYICSIHPSMKGKIVVSQ